MADLDDFFAKKDRKKSKNKKFTTTDEIAKKLHEDLKRDKVVKKDKVPTTNNETEAKISIQEEDEWKEFEEEKKDYTGLKIQNLTIENEGYDEVEENNQNSEDAESVDDENGERIVKKKANGPWKVVAQPQNQEEQPEKIVEKKPAEVVTNLKSSGSYVPPHVLRNMSQPSQPASKAGPRIKNKTAPDVNNEELFPTLSAAKNTEPTIGVWGKKRRDEGVGFEEVRNSKSHTSRYAETAGKMASGKLSLGNKYGALTQDQS